MIEKVETNASYSDPNKIEEFIHKIQSGEIYGEIQNQLEMNLKRRKSKPIPHPNKNIDSIQEKILKKENEVTKLLGEIIRLKNELSLAIEKELNETS